MLFDPEAEEKFYAAATGPDGEETVPFEAAAYVKTRDVRWRVPKHVLFQNLKQFTSRSRRLRTRRSRAQSVEQRGQDVGDECQQRGLDGKPTMHPPVRDR